ncbi:hypothetical protein BDZ94DRAFT_1285958 [Collybia nuda]|uniref:DUF6570 domain-containing protein n=1 Tax=Collybia nuda TaxID=64659 RepID=A0A9P5XSK7_9AGAR|nr:hypothetical protein BDZ94DRAFT_1285958 [Collybia nuda]
MHRIAIGSHVRKSDLLTYFDNHNCIGCNLFTTVFCVNQSRASKARERMKSNYSQSMYKEDKNNQKPYQSESICKESPVKFPPMPSSVNLEHQVIKDFCNEALPHKLDEAGCAVCGELVPLSQMSRLKGIKGLLNILISPGMTRVERKSSTEPIREYKGPVLDYNCDKVCDDCRTCIRKGNIPKNALANGLWLGNVPDALANLNFVERLVSSGMKKMVSHVVAFESPVPKIYTCLPPPIEELDQVLAIMFTGPSQPTGKEYQRTPLLVRKNIVATGLEWLKLNHPGYSNLEISYKNLSEYPEDTPPVSIQFRSSVQNKVPEGTSVFDDEIEDGAVEGDCPFVVHGLTDVPMVISLWIGRYWFWEINRCST